MAFRTDYAPSDPIIPRGKILNRFGEALNQLMPAVVASRRNYNGLGNQSVGDAPFIIGVAEITDDGNTCEVVNGEKQAPCLSEYKYLVRFRYRDTEENKWKNLDMDVGLDAGAYEPPLTFHKGDTIAAYYDAKLRWCIPISGGSSQRFRGRTLEPLNKNASAHVKRFKPGTIAPSDFTDTVYNELVNVGSGKIVYYFLDGGKLFMDATECPLIG